MRVRVIDTETTGMDPAEDRLVEIGSIDVVIEEGKDPHVDLGSAKETLVNPEREIPPEASAVHHIIDADVAMAPKSADAIERFKGADVYIAHNAKFDRAFLPDDWVWACSFKAAVRIWPDAPGHSNQVLRYWFAIHDLPGIQRGTGQTHRALYDARVTAEIVLRLLRSCSIDDMLEWARSPALLPKMPLGDHRGKPLSEVPDGFLKWVLNKKGADFGEDLTFTCRTELDRREQAAAMQAPLSQRVFDICKYAETEEQLEERIKRLIPEVEALPEGAEKTAIRNRYRETRAKLRKAGAQ